ncbi:unnamed protein product [Closterium sp. Yama58-4]|nr:unnamed protein product [Closterium sp. Yama58-4]
MASLQSGYPALGLDPSATRAISTSWWNLDRSLNALIEGINGRISCRAYTTTEGDGSSETDDTIEGLAWNARGGRRRAVRFWREGERRKDLAELCRGGMGQVTLDYVSGCLKRSFQEIAVPRFQRGIREAARIGEGGGRGGNGAGREPKKRGKQHPQMEAARKLRIALDELCAVKYAFTLVLADVAAEVAQCSAKYGVVNMWDAPEGRYGGRESLEGDGAEGGGEEVRAYGEGDGYGNSGASGEGGKADTLVHWAGRLEERMGRAWVWRVQQVMLALRFSGLSFLAHAVLSAVLLARLKAHVHASAGAVFDRRILPRLHRWLQVTALPFITITTCAVTPSTTGTVTPTTGTSTGAAAPIISSRGSRASDEISAVHLRQWHAWLVASFRAALANRLLTAGASTADILQQYVSAIRALRLVDPSGVVLEAVSEPIRQYLRGRKDTIRCIMTLLTQHPSAAPSGAIKGAADVADDPDPIDADPWQSSGQAQRARDIVRVLAGVFGSREVLLGEYRGMLAERLVGRAGYDTDRDVRTLELLKVGGSWREYIQSRYIAWVDVHSFEVLLGEYRGMLAERLVGRAGYDTDRDVRTLELLKVLLGEYRGMLAERLVGRAGYDTDRDVRTLELLKVLCVCAPLEVLLGEYRGMLAERLVGRAGYDTDRDVRTLELLKFDTDRDVRTLELLKFDTDRDVRTLELVKVHVCASDGASKRRRNLFPPHSPSSFLLLYFQLRFGESNLHACEVMLRDMADSTRNNNPALPLSTPHTSRLPLTPPVSPAAFRILRFGESNLHACEVMLRDMADSKRINGNVKAAMRQAREEARDLAEARLNIARSKAIMRRRGGEKEAQDLAEARSAIARSKAIMRRRVKAAMGQARGKEAQVLAEARYAGAHAAIVLIHLLFLLPSVSPSFSNGFTLACRPISGGGREGSSNGTERKHGHGGRSIWVRLICVVASTNARAPGAPPNPPAPAPPPLTRTFTCPDSSGAAAPPPRAARPNLLSRWARLRPDLRTPTFSGDRSADRGQPGNSARTPGQSGGGSSAIGGNRGSERGGQGGFWNVMDALGGEGSGDEEDEGEMEGGEEEEEEAKPEEKEELLEAENLDATIVSALFWPAFQEESVRLPAPVTKLMEEYASNYATLKAPRKLQWKANLGCVTIELEFGNGRNTQQYTVTPVQAAIILKFQTAGAGGGDKGGGSASDGAENGEANKEDETKPQWAASELAAAVGLSVPVLRRRITFWVNQGVIVESVATNRSPPEPLFTAVDQQADPASAGAAGGDRDGDVDAAAGGAGEGAGLGGLREDGEGEDMVAGGELLIGDDGEEEEGGGMVASLEAQRKQESAVHESFITGMLTTFDGLPIERIHNMLKMFVSDPPYDRSLAQLHVFLGVLVAQEKLELRDGLYRKKK